MDSGDPLLWQLLLLLFLILISGFFSCAEIAFISLNKNKLEKKSLSFPGNRESRQAKRILSLMGQPSKFLATIQVGNTLAGFLASAFAASSISGKFALWLIAQGLTIPYYTIAAISLVIITVIISYFQMVLGELVPKRFAMKKADILAFQISGLILIISRVFAPIVWLLTKSTNGLLRLLRIDPEPETYAVTEEEIRLLIDVGSAKGTIKDGEKEILHNVFELGNITAGEIMTHRRDAVVLKLEDSDDEWEKIITENSYSFFPVCGKDTDDIAGVLRARDYLCLKNRNRKEVLAGSVSSAQFVPTSVRTNLLFNRMKNNKNHFAIVLDEHGGMMGIVTMRDLLEELVGSLDDDNSTPPEKPLIVKMENSSGTWIVNGAISLDKAAREMGIILPVERYDTFGGFAFSILGRIPDDGSFTEVEACGLKIKILEVRNRCLEKAIVSLSNMEAEKK